VVREEEEEGTYSYLFSRYNFAFVFLKTLSKLSRPYNEHTMNLLFWIVKNRNKKVKKPECARGVAAAVDSA